MKGTPLAREGKKALPDGRGVRMSATWKTVRVFISSTFRDM
jgi:hypothetical protein